MVIPTFVCSGNHDASSDSYNLQNLNLNDFDSSIDDEDNIDMYEDDPFETERCTWLNNIANNNVFTDNCIQTIQGVTFGVVPYNNKNGLFQFESCHVLLHHEPPTHTATAIQEGEDFGNDELYYALKNRTISPDYVLCGHVHSPDKNRVSINKTIICNPGASFNYTIPNKNELQIS